MTLTRDAVGWWRERPDPSQAGTLWVGLLIAAALLAGTGTPHQVVVACLLLVSGTLLVSLRWRIGALAVLILLLVGVWLRVAAVGGGWSDVLVVTEAAIRTFLDGVNPYGIGYPQSIPPGAPFAYGPLALLWYVPALDSPRKVELLLSMVILAALAFRGRPIGLALYATLPPLLVTANDGSNDTSAGVLILVALLVAQRKPVPGAALLAIAVAFKPYAFAWLPPLLAYGGITWPLVAFIVVTMLGWGWAVLAWGAGPMLDSFRRADALHVQAYYSLAWVAGDSRLMPEAMWNTVRYLAGAVVAVAGWGWVRTARSFVVVGIAIFLVTLFTGWWSTFAYLAAIAPIMCWHLDDWLGLGRGRVMWPGDPVGVFTRWVDDRWPVLKAWDTPQPEPSKV